MTILVYDVPTDEASSLRTHLERAGFGPIELSPALLLEREEIRFEVEEWRAEEAAALVRDTTPGARRWG